MIARAAVLMLAVASAAVAADVAVWFSPHGGCTDEAVHEIGAARKAILVQAYSFTSAAIAQALVDARHRGVEANWREHRAHSEAW